MTKFIEKTIAGKDAAFWVDIEIEDSSFDHEFGVERCETVVFNIEHCEGCTAIEAEQWCERNRFELVKWMLAECED